MPGYSSTGMSLHRSNGEVPSRPSSASSFSSSSYSEEHATRNNNSFQNKRPYQDNRYGGHSSRYNSGNFESRSTGYEQRQGYDKFDSALMKVNAGKLGLDPSLMPSIKKDFYKEHPDVTKMTTIQIDEFRKSAQMIITGKEIPKPVFEIAQAGFPSSIERKFEAQGYTKPTPIQAQGWPMALSGKNMVGIAQTGSGKTLSFVLPALVHIKGQTPNAKGDGPIALILAPTRELAVQIQEVARVFSNAIHINSTCLYGGAPKGLQIRNVRNGCEIIVATPGRLIDLVTENIFTLQRCSFVVLDEADRMLDMGFEPQIRQILSLIRTDRQVLMWSATWPKSVQQLAYDMLGHDYIQVKIGTAELHANKKIKQNVTICSELDKKDSLNRVLQEVWDAILEPKNGEQKQMVRTIIFCNKKRTVDYITTNLRRDYWPVVAIHGDKTQNERDHAIRMLKNGEMSILVATDVAARGLDVKDVMVVINFDMPNDIENYIHRIGRTARGLAQEGASYAFITEEDKAIIADLIKIMRDAGQEVPAELDAMAPRRRGGMQRNHGARYGYGRDRAFQSRSHTYTHTRF